MKQFGFSVLNYITIITNIMTQPGDHYFIEAKSAKPALKKMVSLPFFLNTSDPFSSFCDYSATTTANSGNKDF